MLTETEKRQAAANGWLVCDVFDMCIARWIVQVLPTANNPIKNAADLLTVVINRASMNDALAQRILNAVMNRPETKQKARKK